MTAALVVLLLALAVVGSYVERRVAHTRGWAAGYREAEAVSREANTAALLQLANLERAEADRFDATHPA